MIENNKLTVSELAALLITASNKEVDDFNDVFDILTIEVLNNKKLLSTIDSYKKTEIKYLELQKKHKELKKDSDIQVINTEQLIREYEQMKDKLCNCTELLKAYKEIGTPKKIREKVKNYKNKILTLTSAVNSIKSTEKTYRKDIQSYKNQIDELRLSETKSSLMSVWYEDGEGLMIFPAKLTMQIGDLKEKQTTLLFMTQAGCGKLIALDEEGAPVVCSTKEDVQPKEKTLEIAGQLLRKWRRNNWKLDISDLDLKNK